MKEHMVIGIDVGGTKIAGGLVTSSGKILARKKIPTPGEATRKKTVAAVADIVSTLIAEAGCESNSVGAVGAGVPGIVDTGKGVIIATPNMDLAGARFGDELKKALKKRVFLGNDVNLGVLGEQWLGAAANRRYVVGLFAGTGLGAGVLIDGNLMTGAHGAAAEIGHMTIVPDGQKCTCGNRGCLEAYVGRWAIERDICKAIKKGRKTRVGKIARKCGTGKLKSKLLAKALMKNDPVVTPVLHAVSVALGQACISLRHIFDPELIVLGGGVIEACSDFMLPVIRETFGSDKFFKNIKPCAIAKSRLGDDAVIIGAAALALQSK